MFGFKKKSSNENATTAGGMQSYTSTKLGRARHDVEYEFFPDFFYDNAAGFVDMLLEPYGLSNLYCQALKEAGLRPKYYVDEFKMDSRKTDEGDYLISCGLPTPEYPTLCYRMHFIFDPTFSRKAIFAVERGEEAGGALCLWDAKGNHREIRPLEQPDLSQAEDKAAMLAEELETVVEQFRQLQDPELAAENPEETE